jgi:hypothetical protein
MNPAMTNASGFDEHRLAQQVMRENACICAHNIAVKKIVEIIKRIEGGCTPEKKEQEMVEARQNECTDSQCETPRATDNVTRIKDRDCFTAGMPSGKKPKKITVRPTTSETVRTHRPVSEARSIA